MYPYPNDNVGELAGLAVHADYRDSGRGQALLAYLERRAKKIGVKRLFVLTTQTAHWFIERGFEAAELSALPVKKQALYNYQRRSQVYIKNL